MLSSLFIPSKKIEQRDTAKKMDRGNDRPSAEEEPNAKMAR